MRWLELRVDSCKKAISNSEQIKAFYLRHKHLIIRNFLYLFAFEYIPVDISNNIYCQQAKACSLDQLFELWLVWKLKENMFSMERVEQKSEWYLMKHLKFQIWLKLLQQETDLMQHYSSWLTRGMMGMTFCKHLKHGNQMYFYPVNMVKRFIWKIGGWWIVISLPFVVFCRQDSSDEGGEIDICLRFVKLCLFQKEFVVHLEIFIEL